jgi:hypothetical protein
MFGPLQDIGEPSFRPDSRSLIFGLQVAGAFSRWKAHMGSVWTFVRKPSNQRLLSWLGGGGVVIATGIWAVLTYIWPAHESQKVECVPWR